jgi:hypothetical protein
MGLVADIVNTITKPVSDYFTRRMELKSAERQQQAAIQQATVDRQIELIKQGLTADMNWEMEFARQAATSWKDEYTLLVVSLPLIMAFIPGLAPYVEQGFASFAKTPVWYQMMVQVIFYATYGIRFWRRSQSDT